MTSLNRYLTFACLCVLAGCTPDTKPPLRDQTAPVEKASEPTTNISASVPAQETAITKLADSNAGVDLSLSLEPTTCKSGESVKCSVNIHTKADWHFYAMSGGSGPSQPTRIKLEAPDWMEPQADWVAPEATVHLSNFGAEMIHSGDIAITRSILIKPNAPVGLHHVPCSVTLQACNANRCLPPQTFTFNLPITVSP